MRLIAYTYFVLSVLTFVCCSNTTSKKHNPNQSAEQTQSANTPKNTPNKNTLTKNNDISDDIYELPEEPYRVNIEKALKSAKTINLSEYCDSIEYVPIESRPELYMSNLTTNNCVIYHNFIYYHGPWGSGSKIFDINGKLVSDKIGTEGRAYGEFVRQYNQELNEYKKELVGTDPESKKILIYDTVGNFKREIPFNNRITTQSKTIFERAFPLGQYYLIGSRNYATKEYHLTILDSIGNIISSNRIGKMPDGLQLRRNPSLNLSLQNGLLHLIDIMSDTVFTYNHKLEKKAGYILELGKYKPTKLTTENDQYYIVNKIIENRQIALFRGRVQQSTLPYLLHSSNQLVYLIYDKQNGSCRALPPDKYRKWFVFNNDIDGGIPFNPVMIKGNKMFQFIDAYNFIKYSKECSSPKVKEIAATLTEDSNHVMIIAHFKE